LLDSLLSAEEAQLADKLLAKRRLELSRRLQAERAQHLADMAGRGLLHSSKDISGVMRGAMRSFTEGQRLRVEVVDEVLRKVGKPWTAELATGLQEDTQQGIERAVEDTMRAVREYLARSGLPQTNAPDPAQIRSGLLQSAHELRTELDIRVLDAAAMVRSAEADAYAKLRVVELRLREFIAQAMRAEFGPDWIKHQVPGETWSRWKERQTIGDSKPYPWMQHAPSLLDFADFSDCKEIIVKNDNWDRVFKPLLKRKDYVEQKLDELYAFRNEVMHMRPLGKDALDALDLHSREVLALLGQSGR